MFNYTYCSKDINSLTEEESEEEETPQQAELTRAQRKELKKTKKQAAQKAEEEDEDEDGQEPLAANPNIASGKQRSLASLNAPRELSRKERYVQSQAIIACTSD